MLPPEPDLTNRRPVWDALQMFWMDTDPEQELDPAARICARSKYSLAEIEQIFWNEVRPAVRFNLKLVAGQWTGFEIGWLSQRILETHRFGRRLPLRFLHRGESAWLNRLTTAIERMRTHSR